MTDLPATQGRLRVLCLEDSRLDADLVCRELERAGYRVEMDLVAERGRFEEALAHRSYDVILADYTLPSFDARTALELAAAACPLTPFICVSGTIGEETTVELLKSGAVDCVLKERLARLPYAVQRAIAEKTQERERKDAERRLAAAVVDWRETFDAMRDSVALFDAEGRVVRCNGATVELTGRGFSDIVGRHCYEVFHGTGTYHPACPQLRARATGCAEMATFEQDDRWLRATFAPHMDAKGQVNGGVHVVSDVSELKEAERRLLESVRRQEAVTDGVIAALARNVEVRDPYTAGHERRVSELAVAIVLAMGLDDEVVKGVQVAGKLHDVGKIVVPVEILSRPGRLSAEEFLLIKEHAEAGYKVLEAIEFAWPVADITLQHHERLDGSGYPAGLRGEEILLEARILAVADVVEAMISHRPYRAALTLDEAIQELQDGAGTRYDAAACAAATQLFREQGFTFSE